MTTKERYDKIRMTLIQNGPIHIYFEDAWNIFRNQFSKGIAGPKERYRDIARQVYNLTKEGSVIDNSV